MKFLLDTSVFLWALDADFRLNARAREILTTPSQELFLSAVSVWEIAIKFAPGSLPLPKAPSEYISVAVRTWGLRKKATPIPEVLRKMEFIYGKQEPCWPTDPYGFLVRWHCGYPASDAACAKVGNH